MSEKKSKVEEINWWVWKFEEKYVEINETLAELKKQGELVLDIKSQTRRGKSKYKTEKEEKLEEEIDSLYKKMIVSCRTGVEKLVNTSKEEKLDILKYEEDLESLSKTWIEYKVVIEEKMKELDDEQMKPNEELVEALKLFNIVFDKLEEQCKKQEVKLPWQIRYYYVMPSKKKKDEDGKVEFSGGVITDREGKRINEARCDLSGKLIQHWGDGEGDNRYRHMNFPIHHSEDMHYLLQELIKNVEVVSKKSNKSFKNIILSISKYAYDVFYLENNIPAFLRWDVTDTRTCRDYIYETFQTYKDRLALGTSKLTASQNKNLITFGKEEMIEFNNYLWLKFEEVGKYSIGLARAFKNMMKEKSLIGVCGMNRNEFAITDFATAMARMVMVGIHSTFGESPTTHVIRNSKLSAIVCEEDRLLMFCKIICDSKIDHVKHIILMDHDPNYKNCYSVVEGGLSNEQLKYLRKIGIQFHFIDDLSLQTKYHSKIPLQVEIDHESREKKKMEKKLEERETEEKNGEMEDDIFTILYTSGSTGLAKGVIVSDKSFRTDCGAVILAYPLIGVSFIPLSHSSDRIRIWEFLGNGGRIGMAQYCHSNWSDHETKKKLGLISSDKDSGGKLSLNNVDKLMINLSKIEPLAVAFPPRIWNGLYSIYNKELRKNLESLEEKEAKLKAVEHIKSLVGRNIQVVATGGAPTSSLIMSWIQEVFSDQVFMESYGTTEAGAITENSKAVFGCQIKLKDLPEKGFTNADKPYPRGEIVVKTRTMSSGYYNNPEETEKAFDNFGWFHTGDLGTIGEEGKVQILERVKAVFSLKSGKVVCPNKLESMFESCKFIKQIYLNGNPNHDFLVGLIVVDHEEKIDKELEEKILEEMKDVCLKEKGDQELIPRRILITKKTFSTKNKMLNIHFKKVRSEIYSNWKEEILKLFEM